MYSLIILFTHMSYVMYDILLLVCVILILFDFILKQILRHVNITVNPTGP